MLIRLSLFFIAAWVLIGLQSCAHPSGGTESAGNAPAGNGFTRSALEGVWEVIACGSAIPRRSGDPAAIPNSKYCFNSTEAYPDLAPDAANDSADGGGEYYLVGGDILVIRTGVPGGVRAFRLVSVSAERIVWQEGIQRITLRRVADSWDGSHAPKLPPRDIPVIHSA